MRTYIMTDSNDCKETIFANNIHDAMESATNTIKAWYESQEKTFYIRASIADDKGNIAAHITVPIHPRAPRCVGDFHDWQRPFSLVGGIEENPGVWGNSGGIIMDEVCLNCGCKKTTNTWDTCPATGMQGLTSIKYEEDYFSDILGMKNAG